MNTMNLTIDARTLENKEQVDRQSAESNCGVLKTKYITSFLLSKSGSTDPMRELPLSPTSKSELEIYPRE